jgi:signal transduction histidine kinase/ActR/RegA family two-component response regulator
VAALVGIAMSEGLRFELSTTVTLGRGDTATYVIADPLVSKRHAEVRRGANGRYYLRDLGATHGTYVNGARITEVMLSSGDEVILGATRLRFEDLDPRMDAVEVEVTDAPHVVEHRLTMEGPAVIRDYARLQIAFEIGQLLAARHDIDGMLRAVLERSLALVPAARGAILLREASGKLVSRAVLLRDGGSDVVSVPRSILDEVVAKRVGIVSSDASVDARFSRATSVVTAGVRAALSVPMIHDKDLLGVVYLDAGQAGVFGERDLEVLAMVAGQTALAVNTARLRARVEQQERLAAVAQVAAGIAHDFANLLTMMLNAAELIAADKSMTEAQRANARVIETSVMHATRLTRKLGTLTRGGPVMPRSVDLVHVLDESTELFRSLLGPRVDLTIDTPKRPIRVIADPTELEQILLNLVFNARDAMDGAGKVSISLSRALVDGRDHAVLLVGDTGSGMSPAVLERIFEPLFTTKAAGRGTGMGLAVVHRLVSEARGKVSASSTVGQGTTFRIEWPMTATMSDLAARSASKSHGELVLVLDDDDAVREVLVAMLGRAGYLVVHARSCEEALAATETLNGLRAVVVDLVLGGASGRQFVERVRALRPEVRVLYTSGYVDAVEAEELTALDAGFLAKPFTERDLAHHMQSIIRGAPADPMPRRLDVLVGYSDGAALLSDYASATNSIAAPASVPFDAGRDIAITIKLENVGREFRIHGHLISVDDALRIAFDPKADSTRDLVLACARGESVPYFRRTEQRISARLSVRLRSETGLVIASHTQNISARGLMLTSDHRLSIGTKVALRIAFPDEEPLTVAGLVQSQRTGPLRGLGIEFLYASDEQRDQVVARLAKLGG